MHSCCQAQRRDRARGRRGWSGPLPLLEIEQIDHVGSRERLCELQEAALLLGGLGLLGDHLTTTNAARAGAQRQNWHRARCNALALRRRRASGSDRFDWRRALVGRERARHRRTGSLRLDDGTSMDHKGLNGGDLCDPCRMEAHWRRRVQRQLARPGHLTYYHQCLGQFKAFDRIESNRIGAVIGRSISVYRC